MTKTCGNCGWFKRTNSTITDPPPVHGKCEWPTSRPLAYWMQKSCVVVPTWGENCLVWKPGEVEGAEEASEAVEEEEPLKLYYIIKREAPIQSRFPKHEIRPMPVVPDSDYSVVESHLPFPEADEKCKALEEKRKKK